MWKLKHQSLGKLPKTQIVESRMKPQTQAPAPNPVLWTVLPCPFTMESCTENLNSQVLPQGRPWVISCGSEPENFFLNLSDTGLRYQNSNSQRFIEHLLCAKNEVAIGGAPVAQAMGMNREGRSLKEQVDRGRGGVQQHPRTPCVSGDAEALHHWHALHRGQHSAHRFLPRTFCSVLKWLLVLGPGKQVCKYDAASIGDIHVARSILSWWPAWETDVVEREYMREEGKGIQSRVFMPSYICYWLGWPHRMWSLCIYVSKEFNTCDYNELVYAKYFTMLFDAETHFLL